jgi:hypothetical protein
VMPSLPYALLRAEGLSDRKGSSLALRSLRAAESITRRHPPRGS